MQNVKEDKRAEEQAKAQLDSIKEMVQAVKDADEKDDDEARDEALTAINEDPLSVTTLLKYEILLCTGGPACRIIGNLSEHKEPESARLEYQDWFTPWVEYPLSSSDEELLLDFARNFYFEE